MCRREQIIELLTLLASEDEQLAYERNVPHVDITTELVCMWFDDQYHPKQRHFSNCFSPDGLLALSEFNQFYDDRVARLPESLGTVHTWLVSPVWREIMQKARETIETIAEQSQALEPAAVADSHGESSPPTQ